MNRTRSRARNRSSTAMLVDHALSERYNLGLYAGPVGTAVVVLRLPNEAERMRGSFNGAVVTGLGNLRRHAVSEPTDRGGARRARCAICSSTLDCSGGRSGEIGTLHSVVGLQFHGEFDDQASVEALVPRRHRGESKICRGYPAARCA